MISSGGVTIENRSPAGRLQPLAAEATPDVAITMKNDRRSSPVPDPLIASSRTRAEDVKSRRRSPLSGPSAARGAIAHPQARLARVSGDSHHLSTHSHPAGHGSGMTTDQLIGVFPG